MHVNDKGQLVTSSNLNIKKLEYHNSYTRISDKGGGKIYSKYAHFGNINNINSPLLDKLMSNVTEFTFAGWLYSAFIARELNILNKHIELSCDGAGRHRVYFQINSGSKIELYQFSSTREEWTHIAIVLHGGWLTVYINGKQVYRTSYPGYHETGTEVWHSDNTDIDDLCLILNQAVWTDNFTPPEEPLLGDLKYKTELWPENTIISDHGNLLVKLY